jgi:hypothetical protein
MPEQAELPNPLEPARVRRHPPTVGGPGAPPLGVLTAEQVDEAIFG